MITLFVSLYFLSYVLRKLRGAKINTLSCGLFGYVGAEPPDMNKIKILGILNESRGVHSCGIFYNNKIQKGVDKQAIFTNFLVNNTINAVEGANIFIGHTRSATSGEHSKDNAHPFLVNDRLVLAHNGTLTNAWTMCNDYGIDHKNIRVDSLALACLIDKEGEKILNEYKGAAALLFYKIESPDSLFVYHGASKKKPDGEEEEERPLYYMKTKTGFYFSSLGYALEAIKESNKETPIVVPYNKVLKFTKDKQERKFFKVDRGNCNVEYPKPVVETRMAIGYPKASDYNGKGTAVLHSVPDKENEYEPEIWRESVPNKAFDTINNFVYWHKSRYWMVTNTEAEQMTKIADGCLKLAKKSGYITEDGTPFYFYKGVLLTGHSAWKTVNSAEVQEKLNTMNFAAIISKYSRYPVTNLEYESEYVPIPAVRFAWYRNGRPEKSGFTPLFSNRTYTFKEGKLVKVTCTDKAEEPLIRKSSAEVVREIIDGDKKVAAKKEEDKAKQTTISFPTEKEKEEDLKKLEAETKFFNKKGWTNDEHIHAELSDIGKNALCSYIRDAAWQQGEEQLLTKDVNDKIDTYFADAVLNSTSILEELPNIGCFNDYLEDAIDDQRILSNTIKGIIKNDKAKPKLELSTDFVQLPTGIWVPKNEVEEDTPPFDADDICTECDGFGINLDDGKNICEACGGKGKKETKKLFSDPELSASKEELLTETEEEVILENDRAQELLEEFMTTIRSFDSTIDSLNELNSSELAEDSCKILIKGMTDIKRGLTEVGSRFGLKNFTDQLNKKSLLC